MNEQTSPQNTRGMRGEQSGAQQGAHSASASYRDAGVDYASLDAGKRLAMAKALSTSPMLAAHGASALDASRGEPAFVFELEGRAFAFVLEGLGTKSVIARQVQEQQGSNRFADVAYDTVAAIVNDLCCAGALPLVVNAYFATGSSDWYRKPERAQALLEGWRQGCADAGCAWGGGESPTLPGLVAEGDIELAGAAVGAVPAARADLSHPSAPARSRGARAAGRRGGARSACRVLDVQHGGGPRAVLRGAAQRGDRGAGGGARLRVHARGTRRGGTSARDPGTAPIDV